MAIFYDSIHEHLHETGIDVNSNLYLPDVTPINQPVTAGGVALVTVIYENVCG